jgi:hypothetical protein
MENKKGVIRRRKLKKKQHNGQAKQDTRTNNDLHRKQKIEQHELILKP